MISLSSPIEPLPLFIPFHLGDPAGIFFFAHAFTLSHQIFEQFVIQTLHCSWNEWFQHPEWIIPIKQTKAEFKAPLLCGQWCQVTPSIVAMSSCSFTFNAEFFQSTACCVVESVHVFCDRHSKQKKAIPDKFHLKIKSCFSLNKKK